MSERLMVCTGNHEEGAPANAVQTHLLEGVTAARVAELFKAMGDPTRVRMIGLLAHTEMCVGDLCLALEISQPAASYQLRILRSLRIVSGRREGKHVYYTLDDEHVHQLYRQAVNHVRHI